MVYKGSKMSVFAGVEMKLPQVDFSFHQSKIKGEDMIVVKEGIQFPQEVPDENYTISSKGDSPAAKVQCDDAKVYTKTFNLFCVFDGHNGQSCSRFCAAFVLPTLLGLIPKRYPPLPPSPEFDNWHRQLAHAVTLLLPHLDQRFAEYSIEAGSTATIVIQYGWHLTVAGLGDSRATCHTGYEISQLTSDHRLDWAPVEVQRVVDSGHTVAQLDYYQLHGPADPGAQGIGPLRLWPGGYALSRAVGDYKAANAVLSSPVVRQYQVPDTGGRLIIASDGVWDPMRKNSKVHKLIKRVTTEDAAEVIVRYTQGLQQRFKDDCSVIVVDMLPTPLLSFLEVQGLHQPTGCTLPFVKQKPSPDAPAIAKKATLALLRDDDVVAWQTMVSCPDSPQDDDCSKGASSSEDRSVSSSNDNAVQSTSKTASDKTFTNWSAESEWGKQIGVRVTQLQEQARAKWNKRTDDPISGFSSVSRLEKDVLDALKMQEQFVKKHYGATRHVARPQGVDTEVMASSDSYIKILRFDALSVMGFNADVACDSVADASQELTRRRKSTPLWGTQSGQINGGETIGGDGGSSRLGQPRKTNI